MIFENDGMAIVLFGSGDIGVMSSEVNERNKIPALSFGELDDPVEIGQLLPDSNGKTDKELGAKVRLMFTKRESIDVVIEGLERIKESMER